MEREPRERDTIGTAAISVRVPDAVRITGLSRSRIYELMRDGEIRYAKDGRSTLIMVDSLKAYVDALVVGRDS